MLAAAAKIGHEKRKTGLAAANTVSLLLLRNSRDSFLANLNQSLLKTPNKLSLFLLTCVLRKQAPNNLLLENSPNLKSQISNLKSQISNLKSQISNLKSQISNLKSQISNLRSEIQ